MPPLGPAAPSPQSASNRDGRRIAQLFRQHRLLPSERNGRVCDLDRILEDDGIDVCESAVRDCGYTACLIRVPGGGGGIMMAGGQDRGRRRFSLAHELGHYHIPSHQDAAATLSCADRDMRARRSDAARREWEANDFATELLMPGARFGADVGSRAATFRTVAALAAADMYDVSLTAAAWRLVETTREACALVVSAGGQVEWVVHSSAWKYLLAERRRPLPSGSAAAAVVGGEAANPDAEEVNAGVWLASADGRSPIPRGITLLESTHAVPRLGQVLSLLWATDSDDE